MELSLSDRTIFFQESDKIDVINEAGERKTYTVHNVRKVLRIVGDKIDADYEVHLI